MHMVQGKCVWERERRGEAKQMWQNVQNGESE